MKKFSPLLVVLCFAACTTKEEPLTIISDTNIQLKYDGTHQFKLNKGNSTVADNEIVWQSSDPKVGTIDKKGLFEGRKIGKTEIIASTQNGSFKADVEILPYYTTYVEPVLDFYKTRQAIKAQERRELISEDAYTMIYHIGNTKALSVIYIFEKDLMIGCGVFFNNKSLKPEVNTFLRERYPESITRGDYPGYLPDTENFTALIKEESGLAVTYVPIGSKGRITDDALYNKVISIMTAKAAEQKLNQ